MARELTPLTRHGRQPDLALVYFRSALLSTVMLPKEGLFFSKAADYLVVILSVILKEIFELSGTALGPFLLSMDDPFDCAVSG